MRRGRGFFKKDLSAQQEESNSFCRIHQHDVLWYVPHSTLNCHLVFRIMNAGWHVCLQTAEPHCTAPHRESRSLWSLHLHSDRQKPVFPPLTAQITSPLIWDAATGWVANVSCWSGVSQREVTCACHLSFRRHSPRLFSPRPSSHWGLRLLFRNHTYFKRQGSLPSQSCGPGVDLKEEWLTESLFCQWKQSIYLIASNSPILLCNFSTHLCGSQFPYLPTGRMDAV